MFSTLMKRENNMIFQFSTFLFFELSIEKKGETKEFL